MEAGHGGHSHGGHAGHAGHSGHAGHAHVYHDQAKLLTHDNSSAETGHYHKGYLDFEHDDRDSEHIVDNYSDEDFDHEHLHDHRNDEHKHGDGHTHESSSNETNYGKNQSPKE